jgi:ubiquinone/menaquinone biosynthesis C-methylase UbiE
MTQHPRRQPLRMMGRLMYLFVRQPNPTDECVTNSYNHISTGYDEAWTSHMRDLSTQLVDRLAPTPGMQALDLTCGTGFVTSLLADKTGQPVVGVDRSQGMIAQARASYGETCQFVHEDILAYLKACPSQRYDLVTCAWGLGYSRPLAVLRQAKRVLKPQGQIAIIDNSLFSLAEIMQCSFLTFLEQPERLQRLMRFRFLTRKGHLGLWLRMAGLRPMYLDQGQRSYTVSSGKQAVQKLQATGAAAGFEYATDTEHQAAVFERFSQILERRYLKEGQIRITHRYIAGIAQS